jgi:hypothetical protein
MKTKRAYLILLFMAILYNLWLWIKLPEEKKYKTELTKEIDELDSLSINK